MATRRTISAVFDELEAKGGFGAEVSDLLRASAMGCLLVMTSGILLPGAVCGTDLDVAAAKFDVWS